MFSGTLDSGDRYETICVFKHSFGCMDIVSSELFAEKQNAWGKSKQPVAVYACELVDDCTHAAYDLYNGMDIKKKT